MKKFIIKYQNKAGRNLEIDIYAPNLDAAILELYKRRGPDIKEIFTIWELLK